MITIKGKIVREGLAVFPDLPSLQLARIIYKDNIDVFRDVENVRDLIRYYRGQKGEKERSKVLDSEFLTESKFKNMFKIKSEAEPVEHYILPKNANKMLLLSDIHFPYHDLEALNASLEYGVNMDMNTILLNGDILDCYQQSRFSKDPRTRYEV